MKLICMIVVLSIMVLVTLVVLFFVPKFIGNTFTNCPQCGKGIPKNTKICGFCQSKL